MSDPIGFWNGVFGGKGSNKAPWGHTEWPVKLLVKSRAHFFEVTLTPPQPESSAESQGQTGMWRKCKTILLLLFFKPRASFMLGKCCPVSAF